MSAALVIVNGQRSIVHAADLWEPCICGTTHHDLVLTADTDDFWFPPLPARQRTITAIAATIADAFRRAR